MAKIFVHGGQCGKETVITARKSSPTECELEFESTCEHIGELAEELKRVAVKRFRNSAWGAGL